MNSSLILFVKKKKDERCTSFKNNVTKERKKAQIVGGWLIGILAKRGFLLGRKVPFEFQGLAVTP